MAQQTPFADSLRLRWSFESGDGDLHSGIDIPNGVPFILDLFSTKLENGRPVRLLEVADKKARESPTITQAIHPNMRYRLRFTLTCEATAPTKGWMDIEIGSEWDSVDVRRLEVGEPQNVYWEG